MKEQHTTTGHQTRTSALANINPGSSGAPRQERGPAWEDCSAASEQALELEPAWEL